jgi:hypothetical protein
VQAHNAARHQLGVSALHVLQAHGGTAPASPAALPPASSNPLVPGAPS